MSTTYPIKDRKKLEAFRDYYRERQPSPRNYTMIVMGLNTAFRISDMLQLKWQDVCLPDGSLCSHIQIEEQKTGKMRTVPINETLRQALEAYRESLPKHTLPCWLFPSPNRQTQPLSRHQAYRIVRSAAAACGLSEQSAAIPCAKRSAITLGRMGRRPPC